MSVEGRLDRVRRHPVTRAGDPTMAATVADIEGRVSAALVHYVEGDPQACLRVLGVPDDQLAALLALVPVLAAFDAATEALAAAVGDDPVRGHVALTTLRERAAEYAAAGDHLRRHGRPETN